MIRSPFTVKEPAEARAYREANFELAPVGPRGWAGGRGSGGGEQAELAGRGDGFGPAVDLELAVDGLDLAADGVG